MAAGEAEAAPAVFALERPRHMLRRARRHGLANVRVSAVRPVAAPHRRGRGHVGKNGRHAFHARREPHMEIPLVVRLERFHAASDRVLGQLAEVRCPVRVHRPVRLETTPLPVDKFLVPFVGGGLDGIVDCQKANALLHQLSELKQVVSPNGRMSTAPVAVDHHCVCTLEDRLVAWPTIEYDDRGN